MTAAGRTFDDVIATARRLARCGPGRLRGQVAVVTGAGIREGTPIGTGAAIALVFAAHGARLVLIDSDKTRAEATYEAVLGLDSDARVVVGDVTDEWTCARGVDAAMAWHRLDTVVNNVGMSPPGGVKDLDLVQWETAFSTNVTAALLMTRASAAHLAKAHGCVINISSLAAIRSLGRTAYAASKSALITLTEETAFALGPHQVRANCLLPGHIHAAMSGLLDPEARARRSGATLLGTEGTAWDVATTAVFLASSDARWITGVTLPVDAGSANLIPMSLDALHG